MIEPTDVHAKLQQACQAIGAALADGPGASGSWTVRLPSDGVHAAKVRCLPDQDHLVCTLAAPLPDAGPPPPGGASLGDLAVQAVCALDVLLAVQVAGAPGGLAATWTIHADGLTVQELTRALAALDRVPGAVAAAGAAYRGLCAQQEQLSRLVAGLREAQPELDALRAQLDQLGAAPQPPRPAAPAPKPAAAAVQAAKVVVPACANPQCARELPLGSAFCPACGTPAPKEQPAVLQPGEAFCAQCGKPLRPGALFCAGCGAKAG